MKAGVKEQSGGHPWVLTSLVCLGLAVLALAVFWIRKCRSSAAPKHEYSALKTDSGSEKLREEQQLKSGIFLTCRHNLLGNERYELKTQLGEIGSRADKHWFTVHDTNLGAERLLTLIPIPAVCPINPCSRSRSTLLELFQSLQHPYIHPILDIEFWDVGAALVSPLSPSGSLKDLIYGGSWHDDYTTKYRSRGEGLPLRMIQCLGRQILEGLLFLQQRHFPSFYHLNSGNVVIQNGVARLAGLENALLCLPPRLPAAPPTLALGYLLFEAAAGYELGAPPSAAHLELELERAPKVADALALIFKGDKTPSLEEVLWCELFRGVELRELRGAPVGKIAVGKEVAGLLDAVRSPMPTSPLRRKDVVVMIEDRRLEDIIEEDNEDLSDFDKASDKR